MNGAKILLNKSFIFGDGINVGELLDLLKREFIRTKDKSTIITLSTSNLATEEVTTVFKCGSCDAIHFENCYGEDHVLNPSQVVYEDKSNVEDIDDACINIVELIAILESESINKKSHISLRNSNSNDNEKLTIAYVCGEGCSAIHLLSGYEEDAFHKN